MRAWTHVGLLVVLSGALAAGALGQSVAEAARQEQRQSKRPGAHVYTNDDFPAHLPEVLPTPSSPEEESPAAAAAQSKKPSAEEVRSAVLSKKQQLRALDARLASLERQLDEWQNANLGSWCPGTYGYYYNPYEAWCQTPQLLLIERDKIQAQRDVAQGELEQMQEEARRMGYRSVVYDPD